MNKYAASFVLSATLPRERCAYLVQLATRYDSEICIQLEQYNANAKSLLGVISLPLIEGKTINICTAGKDAHEAIADISRFFGSVEP